jgi:transglutaminase-like putative cysteine protease
MDGFSANTVPLPDGDTGTRKTLANMRALADKGSREMIVRETVIRAIRSAGVSPHNVEGQIRAWFEWVRDSIYFIHDPANTEWLQSPRYTLHVGAGDFDDRAILLAAGLRSFGVPADFKAVAVDPRRPATFSHVYVTVMIRGRQVALDPTYPSNTMGSEPPRSYRTWMVPA